MKPLTIAGDGSHYRQFVSVEDLAKGNVLALNPIAMHRTYNLDGAEKITIRQIAETIQRIIGHTEIQYVEERPGELSWKGRSQPSRQRGVGLGTPNIPLRGGLRRYIAWYKARELSHGEERAQLDAELRTGKAT